MSLEQKIADLTNAIVVLNATILSSGTAAPAKATRGKAASTETPAPAAAPVVAPAPATPPAAARAPAADTAVAVTPAQIKAAADDLTLLANELGAHAQAVAILGEFGVKKMTEMPQASIPEFHNKIKAAIAKLQPAAGAVSLV